MVPHFCFEANIQIYVWHHGYTNRKRGLKPHSQVTPKEKRTTYTTPFPFCLQQQAHSYCSFILSFSSFYFIPYVIILSLLNYFHLKNVFGVDILFVHFHFSQNTTQLIWYVNGNDDGIHVWLSFNLPTHAQQKQCLYFQWNGFTFVQFIYTWWHEKQPLKCFEHSFLFRVLAVV